MAHPQLDSHFTLGPITALMFLASRHQRAEIRPLRTLHMRASRSFRDLVRGRSVFWIVRACVGFAFLHLLASQYLSDFGAGPMATSRKEEVQCSHPPPASSCPAPLDSTTPHWRNFEDTVTAMKQANVPYQLHAGTLLNFVRDCHLFGDLDFAIPFIWCQENGNEDVLIDAMLAKQFKLKHKFGKVDEFAYEISFIRDDITVDIFTMVETETSYDWGFWAKPSGAHRCTVQRTAVREDFQWGNVTNLRMPVPFDSALTSLYGREWRTPVDNWKWRDIFRIGSCDPKGSKSIVNV
eukprot:CAMPEP_0198297418 /NCGR_PEP_ID=MMETSP1449-20131203/36802_1 /TAXON_ID=420275 /ORGANISM="Attheya septentrionalis, Strain CCMP2084" /LENGTH=293 /DNA_ID=CAMNT_0043998337 /DNA_START=51 /DNA_END=932 /DNA_ORIENTATION=-